jgi:hypothetical protein
MNITLSYETINTNRNNAIIPFHTLMITHDELS